MAWLPKYRQLPLFWNTFVILTVSSVFANQFDVYKAILADYDKNVLPDRNFSGPVIVSVELITFELLNMTWKDENLRWNESEFGGTSFLLISSNLLWKPDIVVNSGLGVDYLTPEEQRSVSVHNNGTVHSMTLCVIINECRLSIEDFPYDIQTCYINLGSWMHPTDLIKLVIGKRRQNATINDYFFRGNGEWSLVSFDKELELFGLDEHKYDEVMYTVKLRRQSIYYICVLLIPTFVTATICLFGLFVPAMNTGERVEKVNMGIATLLSLAIILGIVAGEMPKSTTLPLLGIINIFLASISAQS
uniref:Neurotransmitter-gated ion-channel ligand-binding domain-containing protein n=1 Tax=Plectus sambesii TaxID=2011161 RepID=A0A914WRA2_9BILA